MSKRESDPKIISKRDAWGWATDTKFDTEFHMCDCGSFLKYASNLRHGERWWCLSCKRLFRRTYDKDFDYLY